MTRSHESLYNMLCLFYSVGGGGGIWRDDEDVKRLCEGLESMPRLLNVGQVI